MVLVPGLKVLSRGRCEKYIIVNSNDSMAHTHLDGRLTPRGLTGDNASSLRNKVRWKYRGWQQCEFLPARNWRRRHPSRFAQRSFLRGWRDSPVENGCKKCKVTADNVEYLKREACVCWVYVASPSLRALRPLGVVAFSITSMSSSFAFCR